MKYFKEDCPSYNWYHSKEELVYEFLVVDINTLYDVIFQFYQTILIRKLLESAWRILMGFQHPLLELPIMG